MSNTAVAIRVGWGGVVVVGVCVCVGGGGGGGLEEVGTSLHPQLSSSLAGLPIARSCGLLLLLVLDIQNTSYVGWLGDLQYQQWPLQPPPRSSNPMHTIHGTKRFPGSNLDAEKLNHLGL